MRYHNSAIGQNRLQSRNVGAKTDQFIVNEVALAGIEVKKNIKDYAPGAIVFHQGDACRGVYQIQSGLIGSRRLNAKGDSVLIRLSYPGDILGYQSMMSNVPHHVSTEALKPTRICFVPLKTMQGIIERNPAAAMSFLKRMSQDLNEIEEKLYQASTWDVRSRFTRLLLDMKDRFLVSSNAGGVVIEIPVSRLKLAELIGVRPETISRIIRELSDEGVLRFKGRYVRIPNIEALSGQFSGEMAI